ncbi:MAG: leucine-rich repeat domain-containing protein [Roseburia sp.]|nr:leucine-rich repeat domain-containing protein [Roseburia sp.]MCM1279170.1 leucine-rich repeat domain-containing protein [Robinsoniella sp.]
MKKISKRIIAGFMALVMVFGVVLSGQMTVLAKETELLAEGEMDVDGSEDDMGDVPADDMVDDGSEDEAEPEPIPIQMTEDNWRYMINDDDNITIVGYGTQATSTDMENQEKEDPITLEIPASLTVSVSGNMVEKEVTAIGCGIYGSYPYSYPYPWPGNLETVIIPSTVLSIEDNAFNNSSLSTIEIPENITSIGGFAFFDCNNLTEVTFSEDSQLTNIGEHAFVYCDKLTSIRLPDSLKSTGNSLFSRCEALETVILPEHFERIESSTFDFCESLTTIELPDTLTFIGGGAFSNSGLVEITIPDSVTEIQLGAFDSCKELENISLPNNLEELPSRLFAGCTSLTSIEIPDSVTYISNSVFKNCTSLETISLPAQAGMWTMEAFCGCTSLQSITLPTNLIRIDHDTFKDCSSLTDIVLPDGIQLIEENAFSGCTSLTELYIPVSTKEMRWDVFANCTSLEKIHITESVTKIDEACFSGCSDALTIYTQPGTYAEEYGNTYNIPVVYEDAPIKDPTEDPIENPEGLQNPVKNSDGTVKYDYVYFGSYPQSDVTGQTKEKVKWRVLSVDGDVALLLSDKCLDIYKYNEADESMTWEECTLRSWMNGYGADSNQCKIDYSISSNTLINKLFSDEEQEAIPQVTVKADDSFDEADQGNDTQDKIFLLSYNEAINPDYGFLEDAEDDPARIAYNTPYAAAGGSSQAGQTMDVNEPAYWWLRSMQDSLTASYIEVDGRMTVANPLVTEENISVRPALYLDLTSSLWEQVKDDDAEENQCSHENRRTEGAKQATCTEAGYTGDVCCEDCGSTLVPGETIPAKGHQWDNGSVTKNATATEDGIKTITCTVCHSTKTEVIKATGVTEGTQLTDAQTNSMYKITSVKNKTAEYVKPASSQITKASIPATVTLGGTTYKVTSVAAKAFKDCKKLKTVTLGTNVTSIGNQAFYKCTKLSKITIPAKVNKIGKSAFYGCKKLKNITIKTTKLTSKNVGSKAFKGIYAKATVKVPKKKLSAYKKLLKQKGVGSKAVIKK